MCVCVCNEVGSIFDELCGNVLLKCSVFVTSFPCGGKDNSNFHKFPFIGPSASFQCAYAPEKCLIREIRRDLFYRYDAFDEER